MILEHSKELQHKQSVAQEQFLHEKVVPAVMTWASSKDETGIVLA